MDELIAWTEIKLPEAVLQGETHEDWYPLSGKQGDGMEGMIDLVLSFTVCFFSVYMQHNKRSKIVLFLECSTTILHVSDDATSYDGSKCCTSSNACIYNSTATSTGNNTSADSNQRR